MLVSRIVPVPRRIAFIALVVAAVASLLAACTGGSGSGAPSGSSGNGATSSIPTISSTPAPPGTVKPIIQGLIDRQGAPPKSMLPYVHAYVVKVNWAQLQPTKDGPIAADNPIDQALARVRQPDFAAVGMALKLRINAGVGAPDWVKTLGGTPIPYANNQQGASVAGGTIGRFWTPAYLAAYQQLQAKLAALYDAVPQIRELTMSDCSTIFDEPFVRQPGDQRNAAALQAAGYTQAADQKCIADGIAAHEVWKQTTTDVDFNPFPSIENPNAPRNLAFTQSMMTLCRRELGRRCGLENNSLATSKLANKTYAAMYQTMRSLGPPLTFQTAASKRIGDERQVLAAAVTTGANSVELPQGYPKWPTTLLATTRDGLLKNPTS